MVSVVMATYNGERFIERQLESIKNQTVQVDEVIICDDCSTDSTAQICRKFIADNQLQNWHFCANDTNVGYCLNFYGGIARACGDIIFLSDQDDEWHPDKAEKMLACLDENLDIAVLASRYDVIDSESKIIENSGITYLGDKFDDSIEYVDAEGQIGCSHIRGFSLCFRSEIKPLIKSIDLKSLLSHDWLICMIGSLTAKTAILNTILTDYRYHGDNVSLSAMNKKYRVRRLEKRISGIEESLNGHTYLLSICGNETTKKHIEKFILFEKHRKKFLETKNPFRLLSLLFSMKQYNRYYKGNGIRVWVGDFVYAYKK